MTAGAGIEATARLLGHYAWVERRLFEVLGGWVPSVPEPEVKLALVAQSHHHAWHFELWAARLPSVPGLPPERLVAPATPDLARLLGDLAGLDGTVERLAAAYRVLSPRLVAAYSLHLQWTSRVSDGPVARALELALTDEVRDGQAGELLLQGLLATAGEVARAGSCQVDVESRLVRAGGLAGGGPGGGDGGPTGPPRPASGRNS